VLFQTGLLRISANLTFLKLRTLSYFLKPVHEEKQPTLAGWLPVSMEVNTLCGDGIQCGQVNVIIGWHSAGHFHFLFRLGFTFGTSAEAVV
jgi:hypothetical protein